MAPYTTLALSYGPCRAGIVGYPAPDAREADGGQEQGTRVHQQAADRPERLADRSSGAGADYLHRRFTALELRVAFHQVALADEHRNVGVIGGQEENGGSPRHQGRPAEPTRGGPTPVTSPRRA